MRDTILRMTWREVEARVVHWVEWDIGGWTPVASRDRILADRPTRLSWNDGGALTLCGVQLPRSGYLFRDPPVTCDLCLAAEGRDAVEWAEHMLAFEARARAHARTPKHDGGDALTPREEVPAPVGGYRSSPR